MKFVQLFLSYTLAVALAAFYLVPFYMNLKYVNYQIFTVAGFNYSNNFLKYYSWDYFPLLPLVILVISSLNRDHFSKIKFWYLAFCGYVFMMTQFSTFIWQTITPLQYLQFPKRLLASVVPITTFIFVNVYNNHTTRIKTTNSLLVLFFILTIPYSFLTFTSEKIDYLDNVVKKDIIIAKEYETVWMKSKDLDYISLIDSISDMLPLSFISGEGVISGYNSSSRKITFTVNILTERAELLLRRLFFPGLNAKHNNIYEYNALTAISLSKGKHDVIITWQAEGEKIGFIISFISLIILIILTKKS